MDQEAISSLSTTHLHLLQLRFSLNVNWKQAHTCYLSSRRLAGLGVKIVGKCHHFPWRNWTEPFKTFINTVRCLPKQLSDLTCRAGHWYYWQTYLYYILRFNSVIQKYLDLITVFRLFYIILRYFTSTWNSYKMKSQTFTLKASLRSIMIHHTPLLQIQLPASEDCSTQTLKTQEIKTSQSDQLTTDCSLRQKHLKSLSEVKPKKRTVLHTNDSVFRFCVNCSQII